MFLKTVGLVEQLDVDQNVATGRHIGALAARGSGTLVAVAVLAVTVADINQLGAPLFRRALFNGFMLMVALGVSVTAARRRDRIVAQR